MNINYKQAQFELFPGTPGSSDETGRPRYLFAHLNLSMENIVILGIVILMTMVFIFSLGVEKGKKIVLHSSSAPAVISGNSQVSSLGSPVAAISGNVSASNGVVAGQAV